MKLLAWAGTLSRNTLWGVATILSLVGLSLIYHATAQEVALVVDGQIMEIHTHARTVGAALQAAGLAPEPEDRVNPLPDKRLEAGVIIRLDRAYIVDIELEGETKTIKTPETSPANILAAADIRLYPGDRLWVDGRRLSDPTQVYSNRPSRIRVERAVTITLEEDGLTQVILSAAPTLGEALWEAGVVLWEGDRLIPGPETIIEDSLQAKLLRSHPLVIEVDGDRVSTRVVGPTVGEALAESGVALIGLDYAQPDIYEPLPLEGVIHVVRVREKIQVELEPLPFDTIYQTAPDLELDSLQVMDPGQYGVLANRIHIRLEDGQEVDRTVEEAWVAIEPQPRVLGYGTKIVVRTLSTPDGRIEYWRAVPVYATSYSPCRLGVDWCGYHTASGKPVTRGVIGVIRSWYQLMRGWPVYVPNYGMATIEDIGAGIAGRDWVDLGFTDEEWVSWHSWTTLYFLTPVPTLDSIPWILP